MSSTGRGGARADADFYPTPAYAVDRLLERFSPPYCRWLELGAGNGDIVRAVNAWREAAGLPRVHWTAVEMRPECEQQLRAAGADEVYINSAQRWHQVVDPCRRWDVCIMNPPFSEALSLVQVGIARATWTACLERVPWLCDAVERYAFFIEGQRAPVTEYRVGRIDFDGRGGDSIPYSWFTWLADGAPRASWTTEVLRATPSTARVRGALPPPLQASLF